ncbi:MAG: TRAP transporter large permease subunit [Desulfobacteraceae bacterium]|nr:TRAP transporter large permease subunit [Desulfobacteraceae bacterium]
MSLGLAITLMVFVLLILLFSGVRVGFALGIVGLLGLVFLLPGITSPERIMGNLFWSAINKFPLTPVPLFILMGELLVLARMDETLYGTLSLWLGKVRGGLCHATTVSCAIFAAMSGSSLATCATLGRITGPEMLKRGYSKSITYGTISAGGTLGILIPPSITMIVYGNLAGVSIGHCFIAGVIPGILCTITFIILVDIWGRVKPGSMPIVEPTKIKLKAKLLGSVRMIPPMGVIFFVLGGIYLGITTPTEAGAIGALCAFTLCLLQRNLSWRSLWNVLLSTVRTTSFIMVILAGASIVSFVVQYLRVPELLTKSVIELEVSPYVVMALFYMLYLILGMLVDPISMMVMTVPTILPTVVILGFDPIWFAVIVTLACEIGLITPPVGLNLYILRGVSEAPLSEIALGAAPFVIVLILNLAILTAFPILSLWLPSLM